MKLRGLVPNSYIHVSVSDLYIPGSVTDTVHECGNRETEHVLEITRPRSFHFWEYLKSEPVIYIGFSPGHHLQCMGCHAVLVSS
jgi:hypothetical protein